MLDASVRAVADAHGVALTALPRAAQETDKALGRFKEYLADQLTDVPPELDVVLLGSFGRGEVTGGSDCDYLVVLEGTPDHRDIRRVVEAVERVRGYLELNEPGRTGTFGDFVTGTELFGRIGLESDSNSNTTRRLLLLAESRSVLAPEVSGNIRRRVLERYLVDYAPDVGRTKQVRVPHFLLNDLTRYWRTIAVDFGAKQWRSLSSDWFLRYAKLLTTRKVLFAGTLAVLLTAGNELEPMYADGTPDAARVHDRLLSHLQDGLEAAPLARLTRLHDRLEEPGRTALGDLVGAYDAFLGLLDDRVTRNAMKEGRAVVGADPRAEAQALGDRIHTALLAIFHDDPLLAANTRDFGLF